jgi:hypothetical protein
VLGQNVEGCVEPGRLRSWVRSWQLGWVQRVPLSHGTDNDGMGGGSSAGASRIHGGHFSM